MYSTFDDYIKAADNLYDLEATSDVKIADIPDTCGKIAGFLASKSNGYKDHEVICVFHGVVYGNNDKTLEELKKRLQNLGTEFLTIC